MKQQRQRHCIFGSEQISPKNVFKFRNETVPHSNLEFLYCNWWLFVIGIWFQQGVQFMMESAINRFFLDKDGRLSIIQTLNKKVILLWYQHHHEGTKRVDFYFLWFFISEISDTLRGGVFMCYVDFNAIYITIHI